MENYLHPEISETRRLRLPEGLKELMSDITREVLRAQPAQLYKFISDYLSAMLVTREHMAIASRLTDDICCCISECELTEKLKQLGLDEEDSNQATDIINAHFSKNPQVMECSLNEKITKTVRLAEDQISDLQEVIRRSFLRHAAGKARLEQELFKCSSKEEISKAVENTLRIYRGVQPSDEEFNRMAMKIQAVYRAYGVTRYVPRNKASTSEEDSNGHEVEEEPIFVKETVTIKSAPRLTAHFANTEGEASEIDDSVQEEVEIKNTIHAEEHSDDEFKQKRFVSFTREEKELENFDYQNKLPFSGNVECINVEEEIVNDGDSLSLADDVESDLDNYDIDYDVISDSDIFAD